MEKVSRRSGQRVPIGEILKNKPKKAPKTNGPSVFDGVPKSTAEQPKVEISLLQPHSKSVVPPKPFRKLWIGVGVAALLAAGAIFFRPLKKEYEHEFVVTPADESKLAKEDQAQLDSINKKHNEMHQKITNPHEEKLDYLSNLEDPIESFFKKIINGICSVFGSSSDKKVKNNSDEVLSQKFNPKYTAEDSAKVAAAQERLKPSFDYMSSIKELSDASYAKLEIPKYEPLNISKKNDNKDKTEQKKTENPMVVKENETEETKTKVQKTIVPEIVVSETKANAQLKPEIKEESKFVKKYVTDFIKRDLISKPANYTETINSFIKEFGYKPNNDEIAEYVIAKKGDCVSGILVKAKEKELGRNLTRKEIAAIGKLANNLQLRRKTQIKGATNDFIMPGDTIPTRELKMLFK